MAERAGIGGTGIPGTCFGRTGIRAAALVVLAMAIGTGRVAADADYTITDSAAEVTTSVDPGESLVWLNTFPVNASGGWIDLIRVAYGRVGGPSSLNGLPVRILLYEDPNGGSPQDAVLKWVFSTTIQNANTNTMNVYRLPEIQITTNLVAAAVFDNATAVPKGIAAVDLTPPFFASRSWVGFAGTIDPARLDLIPPGQFGTIESFGTSGNFRVEAHGKTTVNDAAVSLTAVEAQPSSVHLSWTGSQAGYNVQRAGRADFLDGQVIAVGIPNTSFDDPTLNDGKTWYYRVR